MAKNILCNTIISNKKIIETRIRNEGYMNIIKKNR